MDEEYPEEEYPLVDEIELEAREALTQFFDENRDRVFYVRQLEIFFERRYFHWVTNRILRELPDIRETWYPLDHGGSAKIIYHKSNRYFKRDASKLIARINSFSEPTVTFALGLHGEQLVLGGFARTRFTLLGENVNSHNGKEWKETRHDIDFIFERDGIDYGVEVKNALGYIEKEELITKTRLCQHLGVIPVFAVRMLPKSWVTDIVHRAHGFALIMRYQMYPPALAELAKNIKDELELPVDSPKRLFDGTMKRFEKWHQMQVKRKNR